MFRNNAIQQKAYIIVCILLLGLTSINAQEIIGMSTRYDDSFKAWDIYDDTDASIGEFVQRWQMNNDFSEWDITFGDVHGNIRQKWKDDFNRWELRLNGETITMKILYNNDVNKWVITDNNTSLDYTTKRYNDASHWIATSKEHGTFEVVIYNEGDPRDWEVFDELSDDISPSFRMAMLFVTTIVSAPRK